MSNVPYGYTEEGEEIPSFSGNFLPKKEKKRELERHEVLGMTLSEFRELQREIAKREREQKLWENEY
jgi:hypothetical protein